MDGQDLKQKLVVAAMTRYNEDVPESFFIGTFIEIYWRRQEIRLSVVGVKQDATYKFDSLLGTLDANLIQEQVDRVVSENER